MRRLLCYLLFLTTSLIAQADVPAPLVVSSSGVERHELEYLAISDPSKALRQIHIAQTAATAEQNWHQLALLDLAQANACRVIADWRCQLNAAVSAYQHSEKTGRTLLMVRALIAESRAASALQDFSRAETCASKAEQLLGKQQNPDLLAEVMLAYSSISHQLGRYQASIEYTQRGEALYSNASNGAPATDNGTLVRLLRNRSRSYTGQGNEVAAGVALQAAMAIKLPEPDPKLLAELHLETARIARRTRDLALQLKSTAAVIKLASELNNKQLYGQALEVQGLAELDQNQQQAAVVSLQRSYQQLLKVNLRRDALRVLQVLLPLKIKQGSPSAEIYLDSQSLIELKSAVDQEDKALAASNFDARLLYAQREIELKQANANNESLLAQQRLLKRNTQLAMTSALSLLALLVVSLLFAWAQHRAKRKILESQQRLRTVTENMPAAIAQFDADQRYVFVNTAGAQQRQSTVDDLLGKKLLSVAQDSDLDQLQAMVKRTLAGETVRFDELVHHGKDTNYYENVFVPNLASQSDSTPTVNGFFALRFDITRIKNAESALAKLASCDSLTGLSNRRTFDTQLELALKRSQYEQTSLTLLALDIDYFKSINDDFGHPVGDDVLCQVAALISSAVRQNDLVARVGGDEFLVLLAGAPNAQIGISAAQKILAATQELRLTDVAAPITLSIGVAFATAPPSARSLLIAADQALYEVKRAGRNGYRVRDLNQTMARSNVINMKHFKS